MILTSEV
jgi:hypothetical protein